MPNTRPRWIAAWDDSFAPTSTVDRQAIIGDIFEDNENSEYTVLKIIGWVKYFTPTIAVNETIAWGINFAHGDLADNFWTNPLIPGAAASFAEDDEGFWITKGQMTIGHEEDGFAPYIWDVDTSSKRVVRETEELSIVVESDVAAATGRLSYYLRILILER